jgi:hypothetical protein
VAVASKNEPRFVDEVFKERSTILPAEVVFSDGSGVGPEVRISEPHPEGFGMSERMRWYS